MPADIAIAGDVNGDGFSDVLVAAPSYDDDGGDRGAVWVYHGGPEGMAPIESWFSLGDQVSEERGFSVASAGDVDADGYSDIIVGQFVYTSNSNTEAGRAVVYLGSPAGLATSPAWAAIGDEDYG